MKRKLFKQGILAIMFFAIFMNLRNLSEAHSEHNPETKEGGILETKEAIDILTTIAMHYNLRQPLILEE